MQRQTGTSPARNGLNEPMRPKTGQSLQRSLQMKRTRMMVFGALFAALAGAGALTLSAEPAYACSGGGSGGDYSWSWDWYWSN